MANPQEFVATRRAVLHRGTLGLGSIALASLLEREHNATAATSPRPHHVARAKHVIFLHMVGAPSQLDLFDPKPELQRFDGQPCPKHLLEGQRFAFLRGHPSLLGTRFRFGQHGECGQYFSELLPNIASISDDIAVIRTVHSELINHGPAQLFFQTGFGRFGRPSLGSWVSYGLGSENDSLPTFVVMLTGALAGAGNALWGNGFLPSVHQGVEFRTQGEPVLFLSNPDGIDPTGRRRILDAVRSLNERQLAEVGDPEIATRIAQYELAFRMQTSVPELMELSGETQATLQAYGATPGKASFANNCLLARRLVERGVRFVQLMDEGWDHHSNLFNSLPGKCRQVDQPIAALIRDLKQRGLLDETLIVWGAEFGRTPMLQGTNANDEPAANPGRDHQKDAFTVWLAGGGVRGGVSIGKTDDLGARPLEEPVHVNDLHATLLHLLGLNHTRLTYRYQGRDFRLTDVGGHVVEKLVG
jgi:hypothetical protein